MAVSRTIVGVTELVAAHISILEDVYGLLDSSDKSISFHQSLMPQTN